MEQIKELPVIFRKFGKREGESVIALFPTVPWSMTNPSSIASYMLNGGHGEASYYHLLYKTKPAKPEEYEETLDVLRSIYEEAGADGNIFKLKVYRKETPQMRGERNTEWHRMKRSYPNDKDTRNPDR